MNIRNVISSFLISTAFISLDGVVEDPGGQTGYRNGGWTFRAVDFVPEAYAIKGTEQEESTAPDLGTAQQKLERCDVPGDCPDGYGVCRYHICYPCKVFPQYCTPVQ